MRRSIYKQNLSAEVYDRALAVWLIFMGVRPARVRSDENDWACLFDDARRVRLLQKRYFEGNRRQAVQGLLAAHQQLGRLTFDSELAREVLGEYSEEG